MKTLFRQLGITDKETAVFLKMLELGAQPVSVIARHAGIPRPTMYLIIGSLKENHLAETFERAGILFARAIPAKNIADVLRAKEHEMEQAGKLLRDKLPELEALENKLSITPRVKFFEGKRAVMKMYEAVLQEKGFRAFFNAQRVKSMMPEYHFKIPETIRENGCEVQELLVNNDDGREYRRLFDSKKHQIKILSKGASFDSDTIICPDKIYMIAYGEKDLVATEIWNRPLAQTQQVLFDALWQTV